jgi:phosphate transport system protein
MVRQEFDGELEAIEARVMKLFAMVGEDLRGATQALLSGDNEVLGNLAEREQVIGVLYPEIEQLVNREILLQAPVASDLRFLLSVLRIVPDLERSHHLVLDIAARASHMLSDDLAPRSRGLLERMGSLASEMWRQAVHSWYQRDRTAAASLRERDAEMDVPDAGGALLRAPRRPRRQHRPPRDLPCRIHPAVAQALIGSRQAGNRADRHRCPAQTRTRDLWIMSKNGPVQGVRRNAGWSPGWRARTGATDLRQAGQ